MADQKMGQAPLTQAAQSGTVGASEKETLLVPLDPNGTSGSVFLCVNGKNLLVQRGEQVRVPSAFAEVYRNAQKQQLAARKVQQAAMSTGNHIR